jgi:hypothetical protein
MSMMQIQPLGLSVTAALLKIDRLNLLLPQVEIRTLESATDIDASSPALHSVGWISYARKRWPVYCLTEELALMAAAPAERRACAMLAMGAGYIGIMCDDMVILKEFSGQRYDLPQAMKLPNTPILHLAAYAEGIASVSNATRLTAYLEQLVANS